MKKVLVLLVVSAMVLSGSVLAFADETTCELPEEVALHLLEVKEAFLSDLVAEGVMDQGEADELYATLFAREGKETLKTLGFGAWLQESEYAEIIFDILPHKGRTEGKGNRTVGMGRYFDEDRHAEMQEKYENGELSEFMAERHAEMQESGSYRGKGRGRNK
jgi:hypothetical protein